MSIPPPADDSASHSPPRSTPAQQDPALSTLPLGSCGHPLYTNDDSPDIAPSIWGPPKCLLCRLRDEFAQATNPPITEPDTEWPSDDEGPPEGDVSEVDVPEVVLPKVTVPEVDVKGAVRSARAKLASYEYEFHQTDGCSTEYVFAAAAERARQEGLYISAELAAEDAAEATKSKKRAKAVKRAPSKATTPVASIGSSSTGTLAAHKDNQENNGKSSSSTITTEPKQLTTILKTPATPKSASKSRIVIFSSLAQIQDRVSTVSHSHRIEGAYRSADLFRRRLPGSNSTYAGYLPQQWAATPAPPRASAIVKQTYGWANTSGHEMSGWAEWEEGGTRKTRSMKED